MVLKILKRFNFFAGPFGLITLFVSVTFSCNNESSFVINGNFRKPDPTPIRLYHLLEEGSQLVDSLNLTEGLTFKLKGKIDHPSIYLLKYFNGQSIYLIIFPGDRIKLDIDNTNSELNYYVEGSPDSKMVSELTMKQNLLIRKMEELNKQLIDSSDNYLLRLKTHLAYSKLFNEHKDYTRNFIYQHPKSLANIMALYQNFGMKSQPLFDRFEDIKIFNFVDSNLVTLYPSSEAVKVLDKEVAETKELIGQKKYLEKSVTEGRALPKFYGVAVSGDTVSIDMNSKKLSLLFFWASWNKYSIAELININKLQNLAGKDNLNVITVSLDNSPGQLNKTLTADSIRVPVVCDYKYWDSEWTARYSIRRIPSTILVNKEGLVISIDIFSKDLTDKIAQLIKIDK
jgi:peroxiredoxin